MKAVILTNYGSPDTLKLKDIEKPVPKDDEILIKVHTVTVSMGDCEMRSLNIPFFMRTLIRLFLGIRKPRKKIILGQEVSGVVEMVGKNIVNYTKGDAVFGHLGFQMGGYAEYAILTKDAIFTQKPSNISHEEVSVLPVGGLNALYFLRKTKIEPGQKVLINGAGGSIGTIALQLAKFYGAKVTVVDSARKLEILQSIGADDVIDYKKEDYTKKGIIYDVVFDIVGKASYTGCIRSI